MPRKRKPDAAEGLMDLVALLPWWAGVLLALVAYWLLHGYAVRPIPVPQPGQPVAHLATAAMWQGLATAGQYIIPFICLAGAIVSAVRRHQRKALFETTSASPTADALQGMTWQQFELLVGEGFRRRGYAVQERGGAGPDGGVDLALTKGGETLLVQCKQWKAFKVGVSTVRELYGVMAAAGAAGGFVVTSGRFTPEAEAFASGRNIRLVDGEGLMQLLREGRAAAGQGAPAPVAVRVPHKARVSTSIEMDREGPPTVPLEAAEPNCPRCGEPMVRRVAKRGAVAGKAFWGCSGFAAGCRGTREIAGG